jgi:hypothetical protein
MIIRKPFLLFMILLICSFTILVLQYLAHNQMAGQ